jgi:hypothetical protein
MNRVLFFATDRPIHVGSYRIWVNDLSQYLKSCGVPCEITGNLEEACASDHEIIICSKADAALAPTFMSPVRKVGIINLSADSKVRPDFVIVGSIEEQISLSYHKNVFLFPLIEKMYQSAEHYKKHVNNDVLRVGFHGSCSHLGKFDFGLKQALEALDRELNLELLVVTAPQPFNWRTGAPNIKNVIIKQWNFNTVRNDLLSCDIGVVPNVTSIDVSKDSDSLSVDLGRYSTDYVTRFKNKSNAGRNFVFHQLGIPVIADLTPSNLHILGNPDCGFVAQNTESWYKALIELRDVSKRQQVANSAKKEFDRLYNPVQWARRLYNNIKEI